MKDYYETLGLQPGAPEREIRRAYREMVKKWRPDFHPNDPACLKKMQEINEAYEMLSPKESQDREMPIQKPTIYYADAKEDPFLRYFRKLDERRKAAKSKPKVQG